MNRAERRRQQKLAGKAAGLPSGKTTAATQRALEIALQHHMAGRQAKARDLYGRILRDQPNQPIALNLLGVLATQAGQGDLAVELISKAIAIAPKYAEAHNNLANEFQRQGRLDEAVASYRRATALKPDYAEAHANMGNAQRRLGNLDEAVACYQKALAHNAALPGALNNLCEIFEKTNNTEALRETVAMARRSLPTDPRFALRQAQLLHRDGDDAKARAVLETAGEKGVTAVAFLGIRAHLLGVLCDRLDDRPAAFDYFTAGNRLSHNTPEAANADGAAYMARIDHLTEQFTDDWTAGWRPLDGTDDDRNDPVFLVGFPRSGTTLLDTILRSHHAISVVEEISAVRLVQDALARLPSGYPGSLATLDQAERASLREIYFSELDKQSAAQDRMGIMIDKLPLNIIQAGLIHRIFPKARFLFAQRHPCDCVLSCFMQNFEINEAMVNFLDLEDSARLYHKAMTLWRQYQAVLPLQVFSLRYESLVEGLQETLTPLLDFLNLEWDEGMRHYTETAARRGIINTPSYHQVTQPLYKRSRGRWEQYRDQMQPVLPILLPWAERLGYDG